MDIKRLLAVLITILPSTSLFTQTNNTQVKWTTFYNGQSINGIATKGKDLWVGTIAGLVYINLENDSTKLYDKANTEIELKNSNPLLVDSQNNLVFTRGGAGPLYSNKVSFWPGGQYYDVNSYVEDKNGGKWIGYTYWGIEKFEIVNSQLISTAKFTKQNSPLPSDNVRKIQFDKDWNLWIATYEYDFRDTLDAGIVKYDGKNWMVYNKKNSPIETNQITGFVIDKNGSIWVGTEKEKVYKFSNDTWTGYKIKGSGNSISSGVSAMAVDSSNNIWIGTTFNGLYRYDGKESKLYDGNNSNLRSNHIHALAVDYKGRLWVGTQIGLYRFENGDFKEFNTSNSTLPSPMLKKAVKDSKGNIWSIAEDYGSPPNSSKNTNSVVRYDGEKFSYLNIKDIGAGSYIINSLVVSMQSDDLWIATNKGLFKYDGNTLTPFTSGFPIGFQAESMCSDNFGNIWIGESDGTISKFDGETLKIYTEDQLPYPMTWITKMYYDGRYVWAGELMGDKRLLRIDPLKSGTKLFSEKIYCPINEISDIILDKKGTLWVSSNSYNLARYKDSKWEILDNKNSNIISEAVSSMTIDDKQRLIIGYKESRTTLTWGSSGISILDGDKWTNFSYNTTKLGIKYINSILTDNNDNIWAIGGLGVSIMNIEEPNLKYDLVIELENKLFQNFPNPFNPSTTIKYYLTQASRVKLKIFNILGREVRTIIDVQNEKGNYYVLWDGNDNKGSAVSSGFYVYTLITDEGIHSKKMLLLK